MGHMNAMKGCLSRKGDGWGGGASRLARVPLTGAPAVPGGLSPSQGKRHRDFCLASCVTKPITAHRI